MKITLITDDGKYDLTNEQGKRRFCSYDSMASNELRWRNFSDKIHH